MCIKIDAINGMVTKKSVENNRMKVFVSLELLLPSNILQTLYDESFVLFVTYEPRHEKTVFGGGGGGGSQTTKGQSSLSNAICCSCDWYCKSYF